MLEILMILRIIAYKKNQVKNKQPSKHTLLVVVFLINGDVVKSIVQ